MPRATLPVMRRSVPIASATARACSGDLMSGAVAISTRGMPSLSSLKTAVPAFSSTMPALSSSRAMAWMPIGEPLAEIEPPTEIIEVRWKPPVFEPSTTAFRMTSISSTGREFSMSAISSAASSACSFSLWGGSSSISTGQSLS
ncbi:Uncharacterised protein [Candidatus Burarchaeum australiense]|nr:Uncharacterised protein [Candidatus Burarchaeum australiense]